MRGQSRVQYGSATIISSGKDCNENQDSFTCRVGRSGEMVMGVFDGHGSSGDKVSGFAKETWVNKLHERLRSDSNHARALYGAIKDTKKALKANARHLDSKHSGTTAVTALKMGDRLVVANVGDSRAVLGRRSDTGRHVRAVELSSDHTPDRPDEAKRLQKANGRVHPSMLIDGNTGSTEYVGPNRVWDRHGDHGLAMSRSLGDTHLNPYVIAEPEITQKRLDSKDQYLVLASDGIWDVIGNQEAVEIAAKYQQPSEASKHLTRLARMRWHEETGGMMSDDITAVVARLN
jgi:serine/threonine protein phosphatase PrpC